MFAGKNQDRKSHTPSKRREPPKLKAIRVGRETAAPPDLAEVTIRHKEKSKNNSALSDDHYKKIELDRNQKSKRYARLSSCISVASTAIAFGVIAAAYPELSSTSKTLLSTTIAIPVWYGTYFSLFNKWKNKLIEADPKAKDFFAKNRVKATAKMIAFGEATWVTSRLLMDKLLISSAVLLENSLGQSATKIFSKPELTETFLATLSHGILAFVIFPKYIMPLAHKLFDQKKLNGSQEK